MRCPFLVALVCLCCLTITASQAIDNDQIIHVPGGVATLPEAIALARSGDVIELAAGHHEIVGRGYQLKAGLTIRVDSGTAGACILEEVAAFEGDWRDQPVFILDQSGKPCRIEGLEFRHWNLSDSPQQTISNPIIRVLSGELHAVDCHWIDSYKKVISFNGGRGRLESCRFEYGAGCPSAIEFHGTELVMENCQFHHACWINDYNGLHGSILRLAAGKTTLADCEFTDNGPLISVLLIDHGATLIARQTCFGCNDAIHEAEIAGYACLSCCLAHPSQWLILEGGTLVLDKPLTDDKAMAHEAKSWSQVKSVFD